MNWILVMLIPVVLQPVNLQNGHNMQRVTGHTVVFENIYDSREDCEKAPEHEKHVHYLIAPNVKHMCIQSRVF